MLTLNHTNTHAHNLSLIHTHSLSDTPTTTFYFYNMLNFDVLSLLWRNGRRKFVNIKENYIFVKNLKPNKYDREHALLDE